MKKNKEINENGVLKNKKPFKFRKKFGQKLIAFGIGVAFALGGLFSFVGCTPKNIDPPVVDPNPPIVEPSDPTGQESITFQEFMQDYKEDALAFIARYVDLSVEEEDLASARVAISANSKDELDKISVMYTKKTGETSRQINVADVSFKTPVDLDDIIDLERSIVAMAGNSVKVQDQKVFEFDAKENYVSEEIKNAIYEAAGLSNEQLKLFTKVEDDENHATFNITSLKDNKLTIREFKVRKKVLEGEDPEKVLLASIQDPLCIMNNAPISTHTLKGEEIYNQKYVQEVFKEDGPGKDDPGKDDPGKDDPVTPQPGDEITNNEIIESLETNCMDDIVLKTLGSRADKSKIINDSKKYYLTSDNNDEITKVELSYLYKSSDENERFIVASIEYASPISKENFVKGNFSKATYKKEYDITYQPAIQANRQDLAKAICNKFDTDSEIENATVLLVDNGGTTTDFGRANKFSVVIISKNKIKEYNIQIKESSSDTEYASKLGDESNYKLGETKEYTFSGTELEKGTSNTTTAIKNFNFTELDEYFDL